MYFPAFCPNFFVYTVIMSKFNAYVAKLIVVDVKKDFARRLKYDRVAVDVKTLNPNFKRSNPL